MRRRVLSSKTTKHSHSGLKYGHVTTFIRQYSVALSGVSHVCMDSGIGRMQNEGKPIPIQPERFTESFEPNEPLPRVGCMELP